MSEAAPEATLASRPCFVIGVTGNMDPDFDALEKKVLVDRLETIFLFLRFGWSAPDPRMGENIPSLGKAFGALAASSDDSLGLKDWNGVDSECELILLTALAPGADTIAAEVVESLSRSVPGFDGRVLAALPFPLHLFRDLNTFVKDPDHLSERDREQQATFDDWMARLPEEDVFVTHLAEDLDEESSLSLSEKLQRDAAIENRCDLRYRVSGEFVASHSHILLSLFDDRFESQSPAGSNDLIEARRRGSASALLPTPDGSFHSQFLPHSTQGPVIHLYHPRRKTLTLDSIPPEGKRRSHPLRLLPPYELGPEDEELRHRISNIWNFPQIAQSLSHQERDELFDEYAEWQAKGIQIFLRTVPG